MDTPARHPGGAKPRLRLVAAALAAVGLGACAVSYDLTLMPRDKGQLMHGSAHSVGNGEASVTITINDRTYTGNWVQVTPEVATDYIGASAWGWGGWGGWGPYGQVDRSVGNSTAKALLQSSDGAGLRCDFYGLTGGHGTGKCTDDKGMVYDVQLRSRNSTS